MSIFSWRIWSYYSFWEKSSLRLKSKLFTQPKRFYVKGPCLLPWLYGWMDLSTGKSGGEDQWRWVPWKRRVMESGGDPTVTWGSVLSREKHTGPPSWDQVLALLCPTETWGHVSPWGSLGFICNVGWCWPWTFVHVIIWHSILSSTGAEMQSVAFSPFSLQCKVQWSPEHITKQRWGGQMRGPGKLGSGVLSPPPRLPVVWLILEKALLRHKIFW